MATQSVLITGTSSGFGRSAAETVARAGHKVFATMRGVEGKNAEAAAGLRTLAEADGLDITVLELDVTKTDDIAAVVAAVAGDGGLDVLVNNAGIFGMGPTEAYTEDQFRHMLETNVIGVHALTRAFLPHLRGRQSGLVINISSGVGRLVMPGAGLYNATKFALEALTESYRYDASEHGIDFVSIEPGAYGTEIFGKNIEPAVESVIGEYPQFMQTLANVGEALGEAVQAESANDPREIGDTILKLIETPHGQRPLRTPVGQDVREAVGAVNQAAAQAQSGFLEGFGFAAYTKLAN